MPETNWPHERKARTLAREHPWPWWEIVEVLGELNGNVKHARIALQQAAALNIRPLGAAMKLASTLKSERDHA